MVIPNFDLLAKARRRYRKEAAKNEDAPALVAGAGEIRANGKLLVLLPRVDGTTIAFSAVPRVEWCFTLESAKHPDAPKEITQSDRAHYALDVLLNVMADAEHRVSKSQPNIAD
jgi:hypothetical protein